MRRSSVAFLAVVLVATLLSTPGRAGVSCRLSDGPNSFGVIEWKHVSHGGWLSLGFRGRDVFEVGENGHDYLLTGVFVIDAVTARTVATYYIVGTKHGTRTYAGYNGRRIVDVSPPQRDSLVGSGNGQALIPGSIPTGTYHIVGLSMGGGDGIGTGGLGDRSEAVTEVAASDLTSCDKLSVSGELRHFDDHDFSGTQVSAPGVALRSGISLDFLNPRQYLVGAMQHSVWRVGVRDASIGDSTLDIETPTGAGRLARDIAPISSKAGPYSFIANQYGLSARVNLNFLTYDLPS